MRIGDNLHHQQIRIEDFIIIGHHTPSNGKHGAENAKIEEHRVMGRNLKVKKEVRIDD